MSKSSSAPGTLLGQRDGGQHDGYGAAQPGPRHERLLAPRHPVRPGAGEHRERPGHEGEQQAREHGDDHVAPARSGPARAAGRASRTARSGPARRRPRRRTGSRRGAAARCCRAPARPCRPRRTRTRAGPPYRRTPGSSASARRAGRGRTTAARPGASARRRRSRPRSPTSHADAQLVDDDARRSRARRGPSAAPVLTSVTSRTVGASLRPDSASRAPVRPRGSGTRRSTENTAAASVGEVTAPSSTASCQSSPNR